LPRLTLASPLFALLPDEERAVARSPRSVVLDATSWPEAAKELRARFPVLADQILSDFDRIKSGFVLVVNDEITTNDDAQRVLDPTDRLYLIAQIAGG
jgi:hypothetical protein